MSKEQTDFAGLVSQQDIDREWSALCERDDRTSPEEYPDHCLITKSELHAIVASFIAAAPASPSPAGGVQAALADLCAKVRSFELADEELRRADNAGTQPRMQRAGNRLYTARQKMLASAHRARAALSSQAQTTGGVE